MEYNVVNQLSALAHPNRLALFRLLMRRYPDEVPAGEIARALELKTNTASTYLNSLRVAGLIVQRRQGASLLYTASIGAMQGLMGTLVTDCCQGRASLCMPESRVLRAPSKDNPFTVLFICSGNAARSIMAERVLNARGAEAIRAISAGSAPATAPDPRVMSVLSHQYPDAAPQVSKSITDAIEGSDHPVDLVVTVCDKAANEGCSPSVAGAYHTHWSHPDPLCQDNVERAISTTLSTLTQQIKHLVSLPFADLSPNDFQTRLDQIAQLRTS